MPTASWVMHSHAHLRQLLCCLWKAHGHVPSASPLQVRWQNGKHQALLDCRHQRRRVCTASAGAPEVRCAQPIRSAEAPARECTSSSSERWMHCLAQVSERVQATDAPVIVKTKQLMAGASDVLSLAQGAHTALQHCQLPDTWLFCLTLPGCTVNVALPLSLELTCLTHLQGWCTGRRLRLRWRRQRRSYATQACLRMGRATACRSWRACLHQAPARLSACWHHDEAIPCYITLC